MDTQEKIGWTIGCIVVALALVALSCCVFMPKTFEGYYLHNGQIWSSHNWEPDMRAFDYTPEMWKYIVENDLHLKTKAPRN